MYHADVKNARVFVYLSEQVSSITNNSNERYIP